MSTSGILFTNNTILPRFNKILPKGIYSSLGINSVVLKPTGFTAGTLGKKRRKITLSMLLTGMTELMDTCVMRLMTEIS